LSSSNLQISDVTLAINEDQCAKQEIRHLTYETVFVLVVGEKRSSTSTFQCYGGPNSASETVSSLVGLRSKTE
jgi:hypothetical protein